MKKYRKAIKITGECAAELYACPVVRKITKLDTPVIVTTYSGVNVTETLSSVVVKLDNCKQNSVSYGKYIVEDVCGHFEVMEPDVWAEVKDDTIEDVVDSPEELPSDEAPLNGFPAKDMEGE